MLIGVPREIKVTPDLCIGGFQTFFLIAGPCVLEDRDEIVGVEAGVGSPLWSFPVVNQYRNNATGPVWGSDGLLWVALLRY